MGGDVELCDKCGKIKEFGNHVCQITSAENTYYGSNLGGSSLYDMLYNTRRQQQAEDLPRPLQYATQASSNCGKYLFKVSFGNDIYELVVGESILKVAEFYDKKRAGMKSIKLLHHINEDIK